MIFLAIAAPIAALIIVGLFGGYEYAKIARDQRYEEAHRDEIARRVEDTGKSEYLAAE
jgi:hypothetical protein